MRIKELMKFPTVIDKTHESCYRCYHILENVKHWIEHKVPHEMILEWLEEFK